MSGSNASEAERQLQEDLEMYAIENPCDACNGQLAYLGTLGNRHHFRCINCGWQQSFEVQP